MKKTYITALFSSKYRSFQKNQLASLCFLTILFFSSFGFSQITITGVANKQVYADSVSFTVHAEAGFDYTAALNDSPVAVDTAVVVDMPQYYELAVSRVETATGTEESTLVQFIVRSSERKNSEWGLPVWTPYPMIDSAAAEFAGAQLEIVTPATYPTGLEIPVIARLQNAEGKRLGVNGTVTAAGFEDHPLQLLRGVGSVFLPSATEAGVLSCQAAIHSLQTPKQISIEANTTWHPVSGIISTSTDWGQQARIRVTGGLTIASDATLTIGAGSIIVVDPDLEIAVAGHIIVNGTNDQPVVFTAQDRSIPWGGFLFESGTCRGDFTGSIFTASGADPKWFSNNPGHGSSHRSEQCLFYLSNGAHVNLTDCYMIENQGQAGHGENSYLTMTGCLVQKCITSGQFNNGSVNLQDTALIEFPSAYAPFADNDNDALYLTGGAHYFTDCLIGWALDDGFDAGSALPGTVDVNSCWFESNYHEAMAWSNDEPGSRMVETTDTVSLNCGQAIECGWGAPVVNATRCFSTANAIGARFGDNYDWSYHGFLTVSDSLLLYNIRDVWGRAWDNWTVHLSQMDIQNNYLTAPNSNYPNNAIWDPQNNPGQLSQLEPFLPTPADSVGIGIAVLDNNQDLTGLQVENKIPVRLSTFTTNSVSADYTVNTNLGILASGTLDFPPGQTVQQIEFAVPSLEGLQQLRVVLSNPVNAEITKYAQVIYQKPYELKKTLVAEGDIWTYFKGTSEPTADWNQLGFNDSTWLAGPSGFGYEASSGYQNCIATNLTDMRGNYYSVYARRLFRVDDPTRITELKLTIEWDDGYILYLNGVPVDSQNPPNPVAYNQPADNDDHEACCGSGCASRQVDLMDFADLLVSGENVLAIQAHNATLSSSDFIFIPTLSSITTPLAGDIEPDGDVDLKDFAGFAMAWLSEEGQGTYNPVCDLDHTGDGSINLLDLSIFIENWLAGL